MPSRRSKERSYFFSARTYLRSRPDYDREVAKLEHGRTLEEVLADRTKPKSVLENGYLKTIAGKVRDEIEASELSALTKIVILALLSPLLAQSTPDNSPTRQGASSAFEVLPPEQPTIPEAEPVEFSNEPIKNLVKKYGKRIAAKTLPPVIHEQIETVADAISESCTLTPIEKRPASTVPNAKKKSRARGTTPSMFSEHNRPTSPAAWMVKPETDPVSWSSLCTDREFIKRFQPTEIELDSETIGHRVNYWQFHTHHCAVCTLVYRYCWPSQSLAVGLSKKQRLDIILLHRWTKSKDELDFCEIIEGIEGCEDLILPDGSVRQIDFLKYLEGVEF